MTDRYDTYLQVRLTTHDKERIKARAKASGEKSTSEYVRKRALGSAEATWPAGQTFYEGHPAVVASKLQAPRNEP